MTLADCVREAQIHNPDVESAGLEQEAARAARWETGGHFGPLIHVDASMQQWDSPFSISFGGGPAFVARDAFTWSFTATAVQPLTGLFAIYEQYHVRDLGVDIAAVRREVAKRDIGYRVMEGYLRVLQAQRLTEVAVTSVDQLTSQLKQANSFHDSGVVSKDDVLRAELALASAKQRVIQTRANVSIGKSRLAVLIGLPAHSDVDLVPLQSEPDVRADGTLDAAESKALATRTEVREIDREIAQSKGNVRLAWYKFAPQISVMGQYLHQEGSQFQQRDAAFVGGTLAWDVWDWGSNIAGINVANARRRQADVARQKVDDQIRLDVREAFLNVSTTAEAVTVAKAAVTSAEEHYRLVGKRYEANTTTAFDVVDAESLLTQARAQLQTSTYDYLIARGALRRATGEMP
jgi:outer membrane protein